MPKALRRGLALLVAIGVGLLAPLGGAAFAQSASAGGSGGSGGTGSASASGASVPFTDLGEVPWAVPGITALQEQGVLRGVAPGVFDPSGPVSRAQMATVLGRLLGWPASATGAAATFKDAASIPSYARPYVVTAAQDGILIGMPGGLFAADVNVTWDQLAVIVARAYTYPQVLASQIPTLVSQLPTGTRTPPWAIEALAQDVQAGDFAGVLTDLYRPDQPVTRAELAALLLQVEQSKGNGSAPVSGSVLTGKVTAVSSTSLTIGNQTVPISGSASVYVGSAVSNLSAVQVGDSASVVLSAGRAILINVIGTPETSTATSLSGTIAALGATQIGLSVPGQATVELPLSPGVTVTVNGAASSLQGLQVGEQATVNLDASGNVAAIAVTGTAAAAATATGSVAAVTATEIVLTVAGGSQQSYPLATDVSVNGLAGNLAAVTVGATVTVTLSGGQVTSIATAGSLAITAGPLAGATVGTPYSASLAATGGTGTYTWTVTGTAPPGLSLSTGGVLSGTPTAAGTYTIPVEVQDSSGATAQATLDLSVGGGAGTLSVVTSTLPDGTVGQAYSATLAASGGSGALSWSYAGTLPAGLGISAAGVLSGTPTAAGESTFSLVVSDTAGETASAAVTLTVGAPGGSIAVATTTLPGAAIGQPYSASLSATGGTGGDAWTYSGPLPAGVTLTLGGQISGTPTVGGDFAFTVTVTDSAGDKASATLSLVVSGTAPTSSPLAVATTSVPAATVGVPYAVALSATGGSGSYTWTFSGGLAPGLSLSQDGVLSGTPSGAGTFYITAEVRDAAGGYAARALTVSVAPAGGSGGTVTVTTSALPNGSVGQPYSASLAASGGTGSYSWVYTGPLPSGVSLSSAGTLSGTPTTSGTYTISVQAVDQAAGQASAARQLTLTITGP